MIWRKDSENMSQFYTFLKHNLETNIDFPYATEW
jgi:hypothetical protein